MPMYKFVSSDLNLSSIGSPFELIDTTQNSVSMTSHETHANFSWICALKDNAVTLGEFLAKFWWYNAPRATEVPIYAEPSEFPP